MRHKLFVTIFKLGSSFYPLVQCSRFSYRIISSWFLFDSISIVCLITPACFMHAPSRAVFAPSTAIVGIVRRAVYDSKSCENEKICWNGKNHDGLTILKCFVDTCYWMTRKNCADAFKWQDFSIPFHFFILPSITLSSFLSLFGSAYVNGTVWSWEWCVRANIINATRKFVKMSQQVWRR